MRVTITAPAFCRRKHISGDGSIELPDAAAVAALYRRLRVPVLLRPLLVTTVNGAPARPSQKLADGDDVSILWPVGGG